MQVDNRAKHSINYMNGQYASLHANAADCVKQFWSTIDKDNYQHRAYDFALARFSVGQVPGRSMRAVGDLWFDASFATPTVDFLCDHEAVLTVRLSKGHFNLDFQASQVLADNYPDRIIQDFEMSFKVGFSVRSLGGDESGMTLGEKHIKFINLQLENATYLPAASNLGHAASWEESETQRSALIHYVGKEYLNFLRRAGNNVVFSLPDFDDRGDETPTVDFSQCASEKYLSQQAYHGISINEINQYLSNKWLAITLAALQKSSSDPVTLEEFKDESGRDCRFEAKFAPMEIRMLCQREAVIILHAKEIKFLTGEKFDSIHLQKDWKIAFICGIQQGDLNGVKHIILDFENLRRQYSLSSFGDLQLVGRYAGLVRYFFDVMERRYLQLLISMGFHVLWEERLTVGHVGPSDGGHGWWKVDSATGELPHDINKEYGHSLGYDHVCAFSEQSINTQFHYLWLKAQNEQESSLSSAFGSFKTTISKYEFHAILGAPKIRLLSNGNKHTAEYTVTLDSGYMTTDGEVAGQTSTVKFNKWQLVFEVDIKTRTATQLSSDSCAGEVHGQRSDRTVHEIYLDLQSSRFRYELCVMSDAKDQTYGAKRNIAVALCQFVQNRYLREVLVQGGFDVLYSFPVFKTGAGGALGLTDYDLQVHKNPGRLGQSFLLVLGVCSGRLKPERRSSTFFIRLRGPCFGSVTISENLFLRQEFLKRLARVNSQTTIIPKFDGVHDGVWQVRLISWEMNEREQKKTVATPTPWLSRGTDKGKLLYTWSNRDEWTHTHEGNNDNLNNGSYVISCYTKNELFIPVGEPLKRDHAYLLQGEIDITLTFHSCHKDGHNNWSSSASAKWSTNIGFDTDAGGLSLCIPPAHPFIESKGFTGNRSHPSFKDAEALLHERLKGSVNLVDILKDADKELSGDWDYVYAGRDKCVLADPIFNTKGDLTFSLVAPTATSPNTESKERGGTFEIQESYLEDAVAARPAEPMTFFDTASEERVQTEIAQAHSLLSGEAAVVAAGDPEKGNAGEVQSQAP